MVSPSMDHHQTGLNLGLGLSSSATTATTTTTNNNNNHFSNGNNNNSNSNSPAKAKAYEHEPSLTLSLSGETATAHHQTTSKVEKKVFGDQEAPCSVSVASSLSNVVSVKRERETASSDDLEIERGSSRITHSDDDEDGSGPTNTPRKKLRLTKDQSALLEESFKQQSTLNPKQKQALADRLNLRPRQVEVWFQNRRARTKLKQTEVDCEYLKKCCETLTDENRRLQKELQELKALKLGQPFYMQLPAATLTMCPSCERIGAGVPIPATTPANSTPPSKPTFALAPPTKSHFYPPQQIRPLLVD